MHVYMYICRYVYMYVCMYVYMHICIYAYMHICIRAYMYAYPCGNRSPVDGLVAPRADAGGHQEVEVLRVVFGPGLQEPQSSLHAAGLLGGCREARLGGLGVQSWVCLGLWGSARPRGDNYS